MTNRKLNASAAITVVLVAAGAAAATRDAAAQRVQSATPVTQDTIAVVRNGSRASQRGPSETFTGAVRIDPLFDPNAVANAGAASVTFEPGARTAWHAHPRGQRLVVTAGVGRVQRWDGPVDEIRPGDVVWIPAGVKHWHGAAPTTAMTHVAVQEAQNGRVVEWMEHVTDAQYQRGPAAR
jgi:quercetin dioxygenase-like cupin family protein